MRQLTIAPDRAKRPRSFRSLTHAQFDVRDSRQGDSGPIPRQLKKAMATYSVSRYYGLAGQLRDCKMVIFWICLGVGLLYLWLAGYWFGWALAFLGFALAVQSIVQDPDDTPCHTIFRIVVVLVLTGIPCITWGWIAPRKDQSFYGRGMIRL
jgi:hypothetical protein